MSVLSTRYARKMFITLFRRLNMRDQLILIIGRLWMWPAIVCIWSRSFEYFRPIEPAYWLADHRFWPGMALIFELVLNGTTLSLKYWNILYFAKNHPVFMIITGSLFMPGISTQVISSAKSWLELYGTNLYKSWLFIVILAGTTIS